ncbi:hypothetical protein K490DRAFT_75608 [Saccharata proteae CBS 121410]|uniref:DNA-directed RNA polymerase III subunit n=1 Tax=Saccharata proteae CBS 121410 TaxID=1314787 RepID=A0A9P4HPZ9_9PEZI|nr:hypothetical protein K490DRAFT_75608 [Saccharata proteae CBS 121410]
MIAGVQVSWEMDGDLEIDTKPSELFPPKPPPIAPAPRRAERTAVGHYRALRERIHEGPLYTVLGTNVRVGKQRSSAKIVADPFEGMPTYTQKYKKQRRTIPRLDTRPYVLRFFPEELHTTLDPTIKAGAGTLKRKRKTLQIARSNRLSRLEQLEEDGDLENEELEKDDDAEDDVEEEKDDDFEEDEDDDDDYNAEQYFDGGDDDDYGDEGGGGGGYDEYD